MPRKRLVLPSQLQQPVAEIHQTAQLINQVEELRTEQPRLLDWLSKQTSQPAALDCQQTLVTQMQQEAMMEAVRQPQRLGSSSI